MDTGKVLESLEAYDTARFWKTSRREEGAGRKLRRKYCMKKKEPKGSLKSSVVWDVILCSLLKINCCLGGTCHLRARNKH
jgi:hypothetical protein